MVIARPDRIRRSRRLWVYDIGFIADVLGPGDAGHLFVHFDGSGGQVVDARVGSFY